MNRVIFVSISTLACIVSAAILFIAVVTYEFYMQWHMEHLRMVAEIEPKTISVNETFNLKLRIWNNKRFYRLKLPKNTGVLIFISDFKGTRIFDDNIYHKITVPGSNNPIELTYQGTLRVDSDSGNLRIELNELGLHREIECAIECISIQVYIEPVPKTLIFAVWGRDRIFKQGFSFMECGFTLDL